MTSSVVTDVADPQPVRIPGLDEDEHRLVNRLLEQLRLKARRNNLRSSYYDGKRAIRQVTSVIPPQYYQLGVVLGWSAKAVDTLVQRCKLDGFIWPDGDIDTLDIAKVIDSNFLKSRVSSALVSSLKHGVVFAINTAGNEDDGEPRSLVHFKTALNATGDFNQRKWRLDNLVSVTDRDNEGHPTGLVLYLDGETVTSRKDRGRWTPADRSFHDWGVPVEAIAYKPDDDRPLGRSRISRTVMSLHDQALRTVIRMEGHMDVYSFPEMWMLGADPSVFKNADGTVKPVWQTMLARIKGIPDDDEAPESLARPDVKQFPASSPQPHLDALKQQAQQFSGESSIPLTSLGVSDMTNPTSADSYRASRQDLVSAAESAIDDWSPPLRRMIVRALAIQNGETKIPDQWSNIDTKWRPPQYQSRAEAADAGQKQLAAIPALAQTDVGFELLGLDEQQITRAMSQLLRAEGRATLKALTAQPPPPTQLTNDGTGSNPAAQ